MGLRTINDPSGLDALLVERLIGISSYDVVKTVASRLPEIITLQPHLSEIEALAQVRGELLSLVPVMPQLQYIAENLEDLVNGTKPASAITYGSETLDAILSRLLYQPIQISNLKIEPSVAEMGSVVPSVDLTWALSRSGVVQRINNVTVNPDDRSFTSTVPIGVDTTYTVHVEDGPVSARVVSEASIKFLFKRKRYWGTSEKAELTDADILSLAGQEFADNLTKTAFFNATGGKYPYYVYPASFGTPTSVKVQGAVFSDYTLTTRAFQNASNLTTAYNIIRFNGRQTGSNIEVNFA